MNTQHIKLKKREMKEEEEEKKKKRRRRRSRIIIRRRQSQTLQLQCYDKTSQPRFLQNPQTMSYYIILCCAVPSLTFLHLQR
jgi:hypothetical protein